MATHQKSPTRVTTAAWILLVLGLVAAPLWYRYSLRTLGAALRSAETADEVAAGVRNLIDRRGDGGRDVVSEFASGSDSAVFLREADVLVNYDASDHTLRSEFISGAPVTVDPTGDPELDQAIAGAMTDAMAGTYHKLHLRFPAEEYLGLEVVDASHGPMVVVKARDAEVLMGVIYERDGDALTGDSMLVDVEPDTFRLRPYVARE
jgi:hypothetical protein